MASVRAVAAVPDVTTIAFVCSDRPYDGRSGNWEQFTVSFPTAKLSIATLNRLLPHRIQAPADASRQVEKAALLAYIADTENTTRLQRVKESCALLILLSWHFFKKEQLGVCLGLQRSLLGIRANRVSNVLKMYAAQQLLDPTRLSFTIPVTYFQDMPVDLARIQRTD